MNIEYVQNNFTQKFMRLKLQILEIFLNNYILKLKQNMQKLSQRSETIHVGTYMKCKNKTWQNTAVQQKANISKASGWRSQSKKY